MASPYVSQSASNYNANPPPDDGSQTAANTVTWAGIKSKLADVLKTYSDNINTAIVNAFNTIFLNAVSLQSAPYTIQSSDRGKLIRVTGATTITLPAASAIGAGWEVTIKNANFQPLGLTVTIAPNGLDAIDAFAGSITLPNAGGQVTLVSDGVSAWHSGSGSAAGPLVVPPTTFQNLLVNGNFDIWQNGTTITDPNPDAAGTAGYTADQWRAGRGTDATGMSVSRQTDVPASPGFRFSAKVQRTAADVSTQQINIFQPVETARAKQLQGQYVTFSAWLKIGANFSGSGSTLLVRIFTGTGTDEGSWNTYTGQVTLLSTNTPALNTSWQRFQFTPTSPVAANATEIAVYLSYLPTGTAGADDSFYVDGAMLVPGQFAGPNEFLPQEIVILDCDRYFFSTFGGTTAPAQNAGVAKAFQFPQAVGAATAASAPDFRFPVPMRAIPAMTLYNPSAANAQIRNASAAADWSGSTTSNTTALNTNISGTSPGGSAAGQSCLVHVVADARMTG